MTEPPGGSPPRLSRPGVRRPGPAARSAPVSADHSPARRRLLVAALGACLPLGGPRAASPFDEADMHAPSEVLGLDPQRRQQPVIPPRTPLEPGDADKVLYFFAFDCTFCLRNDTYFWTWGTSLPAPITFEPVPVIASTTKEILMARAYYAAQIAQPVRIAYFMQETYMALQLAPNDPERLDTYLKCARNAGIAEDAFRKAWNSTASMRALILARKRFAHYQPDATPALVMNGAYLIGPDVTAGDYELFFQLANGLLSQYLVKSGRYRG